MSEVRVEPVTSLDDVPECAAVCWEAIKDDAFTLFFNRYHTEDFHDETVKRLSDAIDPANTSDFAFKAVVDVANENGEGTHEEIVGVTHWYYGNIIMSKYDPITKAYLPEKNEITPDEIAAGSGAGTPARSPTPTKITAKNGEEAMAEVFRQAGNYYVAAIRGKKHVYLRRMMVHPKYQRRGIGQKLLKWGLDRADKEKIVAYLNARPPAMRLYEAAGFQKLGNLDIPIPEGDTDLVVPPGAAMLRMPRPIPEDQE